MNTLPPKPPLAESHRQMGQKLDICGPMRNSSYTPVIRSYEEAKRVYEFIKPKPSGIRPLRRRYDNQRHIRYNEEHDCYECVLYNTPVIKFFKDHAHVWFNGYETYTTKDFLFDLTGLCFQTRQDSGGVILWEAWNDGIKWKHTGYHMSQEGMRVEFLGDGGKEIVYSYGDRKVTRYVKAQPEWKFTPKYKPYKKVLNKAFIKETRSLIKPYVEYAKTMLGMMTVEEIQKTRIREPLKTYLPYLKDKDLWGDLLERTMGLSIKWKWHSPTGFPAGYVIDTEQYEKELVKNIRTKEGVFDEVEVPMEKYVGVGAFPTSSWGFNFKEI